MDAFESEMDNKIMEWLKKEADLLHDLKYKRESVDFKVVVNKFNNFVEELNKEEKEELINNKVINLDLKLRNAPEGYGYLSRLSGLV